jgi:hypothetical protein
MCVTPLISIHVLQMKCSMLMCEKYGISTLDDYGENSSRTDLYHCTTSTLLRRQGDMGTASINPALASDALGPALVAVDRAALGRIRVGYPA